MYRKRNLALVGLFFLAACSGGPKGPDSPQKVLTDYVARTFAMKESSDRAKLLELTTGEVKAALEGLSDEEFKSYFTERHKEFVGLKIRDERKVGEEQYSITYELSYVDKSPGIGGNSTSPNVDKVTNKKHALFSHQNGKWLISEVKNLKTFIEHQNEMSF